MFPVFKKMVLVIETEINSANIRSPLLKGSLNVRVQRHLKKSCIWSCLGVISGSFRVCSQLWAAPPWTNSPSHCPGRHLEHSSGVPHSLHWLRKSSFHPLPKDSTKSLPEELSEDAVSQGSASGGTLAVHPLWPALLTQPCSICTSQPRSPWQRSCHGNLLQNPEEPHSLHC